MKRIKCSKVLLDYLNNNIGWHKKVDLFKIAEEFSPETAGRALRTLFEEGKIQRGFYNGIYAKNLAKYANLGTDTDPKNRVEIIEVDGRRVAVLKEYK